MKMSGAPCSAAYSRSWCTGMKSRVAMAPAATSVAVTGIREDWQYVPHRDVGAAPGVMGTPPTGRTSRSGRSGARPPRPVPTV